MSLKDLLLTPFFLIILYIFIFLFRKKLCKDSKIRPFLIPALTLKIIGAISVGLIYNFYYSGGDTNAYFNLGSKYIWQAFNEDFILGVKLLLDSGGNYPIETYKYTSKIYYYQNESAYLIVRLSAFLGLFCFHTYTIVAILFSLFSFSGLWVLYKTLYRIYPHLYKELAISVFYIPSVIFWGSGLLKDSITIGALGWVFYSSYNIFFEKKKLTFSIIILLVNVYIIKIIKIYILLAFLPALSIWIYFAFMKKFKNKLIKPILGIVLLIFVSVLTFILFDYFSTDSLYSIDNLVKTSATTAEWIAYASQISDGSNYDLGEFEFSPLGMLSIAHKAINVTLFRPYLWETKNVLMLISSLESLFFLFLTLQVIIFKTGIIKTIKLINKDNYLKFSLVFVIIFAFSIGVSTFNFGALARYKIPLLPFFLSFLYIVKDYFKTPSTIPR